MVDKEMAATSAAIEDAVRRIEVRTRVLEVWGLAGCRLHLPQHLASM